MVYVADVAYQPLALDRERRSICESLRPAVQRDATLATPASYLGPRRPVARVPARGASNGAPAVGMVVAKAAGVADEAQQGRFVRLLLAA